MELNFFFNSIALGLFILFLFLELFTINFQLCHIWLLASKRLNRVFYLNLASCGSESLVEDDRTMGIMPIE